MSKLVDAGSYMITCVATGETRELHSKSNAQKAHDSGLFLVETAHEYLCRINEEIKRGRS